MIWIFSDYLLVCQRMSMIIGESAFNHYLINGRTICPAAKKANIFALAANNNRHLRRRHKTTVKIHEIKLSFSCNLAVAS
jgi:hypothetical protein